MKVEAVLIKVTIRKKNGNRSLSIYAHCLPPAKAFVCWQKK